MQRTEAPISERVRALIAEQGISESALARRLGFSQSYVSRRMRGKVPWRAADVVRIAEHFEVPLTQLIPAAIEAAQ